MDVVRRAGTPAALLLLCAFYVAVAGTSVQFKTVQYDEFTDIMIASSLAEHPLVGNALDPSQARLPMYVTAAAMLAAEAFTSVRQPLDFVLLSRWLSIAATVLAILGTYILGCRLFTKRVALLASSLFAFSPYVLDFGADALTQGDAFTAPAVVYTMIAFAWFDRQRSTFALFVLAMCLAIAVSCKFYLVMLIPALFAFHAFGRRTTSLQQPCTSDVPPRSVSRSFMSVAWLAGGLSVLAMISSVSKSGQAAQLRSWLAFTSLGLWAIALVTLGACVWLALREDGKMNSQPRSSVVWHHGAAWIAIAPLTVAATLVLVPAHTLNSAILSTMLDRVLTMDGEGALFTQVNTAFRLYLGVLLFKLGLPLGLLTVASLFWAVRMATVNHRYMLLVIVLAVYVVMLASLPLQQPFWLMSVYPLVMLTLASFITHLVEAARGARWQPVLGFALLSAVGWLCVSLVRVYPAFGYYGYETIGTRWLGSETRGYRALIVMTNDGSTEALDWLRANAPAGSVVLSYLDDVHLMRYLQTTSDLTFELIHVLGLVDRRPSHEDLIESEFAVVRMVDDGFGPASPIHDAEFRRQFGDEPAYEIYRGRGAYRMPVVRIYQRTES